MPGRFVSGHGHDDLAGATALPPRATAQPSQRALWLLRGRRLGRQTIRLEEARSKSGKARVFPFGLASSLKALLEARWAAGDGLYVFHRDGQPLGVGAILSAWKRATKRAGLEGRLLHDLRRSAARDYRRAGVSEGVIMQLCGWETRTMFDRYNVIDGADLAQAVAKRFNGKQTANTDTPTASPSSLSSSAA